MLTTEKPIKAILKFMLPILVLGVFQQLYSLVDAAVVGQVLGESALAAVGAASVVSTFLIGFVRGNFNGFGLIIAKFFGAKKTDELHRAMAGSILLAAGVIALLTAASLIFLRPILILLRTPADILELSCTYLRIIFGGLVFTAAFTFCFSALMAVGDSRAPMYFLIFSSVLNVVLDILLVGTFGLGVAGAAVATVFSQAASAAAAIIYIYKKIRRCFPRARILPCALSRLASLPHQG